MSHQKAIAFVTHSKQLAESELRRLQIQEEELQVSLAQVRGRIQQMQRTIDEANEALQEAEQ